MRHLRGPLALLLVLVLLAACGGSDGGDKQADADREPGVAKESTTTSSTAPRTLSADEVDASASPFCGVWAKILAKGGPDTSGDEAATVREYKAHYSAILPLAKQLDAAAPKEVEAETALTVKIVDEVARTGSFAPFARDDAVAAQKVLAKYIVDHCAKG